MRKRLCNCVQVSSCLDTPPLPQVTLNEALAHVASNVASLELPWSTLMAPPPGVVSVRSAVRSARRGTHAAGARQGWLSSGRQ